MALWIYVSVFAAFMQNLRFMLQKHLKATKLSTGGATFSRFLFSSPLVALGIWAYMSAADEPFPALSGKFWAYALSGGVGQILATACVVALFAERNFAVGIVFKKTEVVLTALLGLVVLGEGVSPLGVVAIAIGFAGVVLLSDPPKGGARFFNKAAGFGLGSGLLFGVSAVGYRGAALQIDSPDVIVRAGVSLAVATAFQTLIMAAWLAWRDKGEIGRVVASWRVSSLVGVTSMCGSFGWFVAFALQNAAYVKAVGQVELVFTFLASYFIFKERSTPKELAGIALIVVSILVLIAAL
ncbi:EamA-like transporter family protein [Litoreibacter ascidiaceicola]|uniref:EamA-like transporter family protein n=1 Tax=Litoreibacter ascidiaceicola TaxID=1486859 RepID=A0A1M4YCZ8_9RHOB|nr:DMT family transporter [Litoreibacter ascidiaceicola]SHF03711.1 EamA-like transporter family protein [Litoreibacter ascidiaceicola]